MSLLNDIGDISRTILSKGINVITTCEEAFFAQNSNPTLYKELDIIAKANGASPSELLPPKLTIEIIKENI